MRETDGRIYAAIDLKSFYASVECRERGLDALNTNLVVADPSRTEKTICLAVSPSLKACGISGRARLFEVVQRVKEVNTARLSHAPGRVFRGSSADAAALKTDASLKLDYLVAPPRMALYMEYSTRILEVYLKYVSMDDIHVYSIDEVLMDITDYLGPRGLTARDFVRMLMLDVLNKTGITATAGIGTNLYLCKIAMDIYAKHVPADEDGVRIAELDEVSYRRYLWDHRPLTDFWRVGRGYARKLEAAGMYTMGDVARCSVRNEALLYRMFGVNAELLIDHAWGWEPCTIREIKAYRPESTSISSGQVLSSPYSFSDARIVVREMADSLGMELLSKGLVTDQIVLTVCYDISGVTGEYRGETETDRYGRTVPKSSHGSGNLPAPTSSSAAVIRRTLELYDAVTDRDLSVRRIYLVANHTVPANGLRETESCEQLDLFSDPAEEQRNRAAEEKERKLQEAMLSIQKKHGKNAILHGTSYQDAATGRDRNGLIGGHRK